jgi:hypothetical protein
MILHVHSQLGEAVRAAARAAFDAELTAVAFHSLPRTSRAIWFHRASTGC